MGRNTTRGKYVKASYTGDERGELSVELNEKKDKKISFDGKQYIGDSTFKEKVRISGDDVDAQLKIKNSLTGNKDKFTFSSEVLQVGEKSERLGKQPETLGRPEPFTRNLAQAFIPLAPTSLNVTENDRLLVGGKMRTDGYAKVYTGE